MPMSAVAACCLLPNNDPFQLPGDGLRPRTHVLGLLLQPAYGQGKEGFLEGNCNLGLVKCRRVPATAPICHHFDFAGMVISSHLSVNRSPHAPLAAC